MSTVDGHSAWDDEGRMYEGRGVARDLAEAARQVKRGARVGFQLSTGEIEWLPEPPVGAATSSKVARAWLETYVGSEPLVFTKWTSVDSEQTMIISQWDC